MLVPIDSVHFDPSNARRHPDRNIETIVASINRFGQRFPIVVQKEGMVVRAGNGRLDAMKKLGWTHVAAVIVDESSTDATAFAIADNRTAELAEWNDETLASLLQSLDKEDREIAGFSDSDLSELLERLTPDVEIKEDEVPEPPDEAITQPGDLWVLGNHRLLCGDSTNARDVAMLLDGAIPVLMVTDPPYGVEYDPTWRAEAGINKNKGKMGLVANDGRADWTEAREHFPGDIAYVFHAGVFASTVQRSLEAVGFAVRAQIVWAKDRMALSRGDYHWQHEPCWYAVREGALGRRTDDRTQTTLWEIPARDDAGHGHGTQKPVECMARPIRNHVADAVYDPFLGSGTTLIAAEQLGRKCYGMEISPQYVDVVVKRWEQLTGRKAELAPR